MDGLKRGADMNKVFNLPVREQIARMRYVDEKEIEQLDALEDQMKKEINALIPVGGDSDAA